MTDIKWPNQLPPDCPFPRSTAFTDIVFTGRHAQYTNADTWYPSWASDGHLYSPWTDGEVNGTRSMSFDRDGVPATTGQAKILGDDPLSLEIVDVALFPGDPAPYGGRYPCGSLVYNGVWYYGTYTLDDINGACGNWCTLGPFIGFRHSTDVGAHWTDTPHTPASPLFEESGKGGVRVKIGAPHFVDFGRNMEYSPDGKAYLVGHGTNRREGFANWIGGDEVYLLRVTPSIQTIDDATAYEFFAGYDATSQAIWTRDFAAIKPLLSWNGQLGCVTMTYNAPLRKFLLCVSRPTDGFTSTGTFDTMIFESDAMTGPWSLLQYMKAFGAQAYFVNIPSKFISADGRTAWLCYSANFSQHLDIRQESTPPGSHYGLCLHEFYLSAS